MQLPGIIAKYANSSKRSKDTINNIILSLIMRAANIVASLLVVPLTINFLDQTRYGIWLTLSSIISWVTFFDLGLSHGFRNRFAEAKARGEANLARQYVSTTYAIIIIIVSILTIITLFLNHFFIDWPALLHIQQSYKQELTLVFAVVIIFTCIGMITNIFSSLLAADQKVGIASIIQAIGQYIALLLIYILSQNTDGSIASLAICYSGAPCIFALMVSIVAFLFGGYRQYRPSIKYIKFELTESIINLGMKFFTIQLCMLAVFQIINIIISRELGPDAVTQYNIANKYFNIILMTLTIIITPFWSAFTDAYTKGDYVWMKSAHKKLLQLFAMSIVLYILLLTISPFVYGLWIGTSVSIPFTVSASMAFCVFCQTYSTVNSYIINGIGTLKIQTIVYIFFALTSWLFLTLSCKLGLEGLIIYIGLIYLVIALFEQIQLSRIFNKKAKGIWIE